jgi:polyphenol oxidase
MKTREATVDGVLLPVLESAIWPAGFAHGFATRAGGVSAAPFQSLNLGLSWGDDREAVLENRRRLLLACGLDRLFLLKQVHGAEVAQVRSEDDPQGWRPIEADALITDVPGAALGVFSADCVPLLFADPDTGACAAVHAGWRGVIAGVARATLAALATAYGSRPAALRVAMGPAIGPCCFEVGEEVVAAFSGAYPGGAERGVVVQEAPSRRARVDLKGALRIDLEAGGIPPGQIDAGDECTRCDPAARFFSYRRDRGRGGQHLSIVARLARRH